MANPVYGWVGDMWTGVWKLLREQGSDVYDGVSQAFVGKTKDALPGITEGERLYAKPGAFGKDTVPPHPTGTPLQHPSPPELFAQGTWYQRMLDYETDSSMFSFSCGPQTQAFVDKVLEEFGFFGYLFAGIPYILEFAMSLLGRVGVAKESAERLMKYRYPGEPADITTCIALAMRYPEYERELQWMAQFSGVDSQVWHYYREAARKIFTEDQVYLIEKRFANNPTWKNMHPGWSYDNELKRLGWDGNDLTELKSLLEYFPPIQDLVRFAVREVYDEAFVNTWQLNPTWPPGLEDPNAATVLALLKGKGAPPADYLRDATWAGMGSTHATSYWRAHWELPSPTMAFDMFHRGIIDMTELTQLLIAQDYMPGWIPRMIKLAYHPLTRVDIRRMYETGIIRDRTALTRCYLDIGYSPDDAGKHADFVIAQESGISRKAQAQDWVGEYEKGNIPEDTARQHLVVLGYDTATIDRMLQVGAIRRAKEERDLWLKALQRQFRGDPSLESTIKQRLIDAGYTDFNAGNLIESWKPMPEARKESISTKDLGSFLSIGAYTAEQYLAAMRGKGFTDTEIRAYMQLGGLDDYIPLLGL